MNLDGQTYIESLLNANKIRYSILDSMVKQIKINSNVVLYFDVNSLLDILFRSNNLENVHTISKEDYFTISSQLINTVAHYRHYFYSRHQKSTIIYLIYTDELPSKYFLSLYKEYKKDFINLRNNKDNKATLNLQNNIKRNIKLVDMLCQYIPDVFFIKTGKNEIGSTMQYLIETDELKNHTNLIYTNDKVQYQLINNDNTYIINNKQDKSLFITPNNLYKVLTKKDEIIISSELYKIILSITGFKKYNITGIKGIQNLKAIKLLEKAIDKDILLNREYNSITNIIDLMIQEKLLKEESKDIILNNFKIFNYRNQVKTFTDIYLNNINNQLINRTDYDQIVYISNKYYPTQPLMFLELMETFNK